MSSSRPGISSLRDIGALAACVFGIGTTALVLSSYATGPFVYPLSQTFGWTRQAILTAPSVLTIVVLCVSFGVGWLTDRTAPRLLIIPSQIAFGLSFIALGLLTNADIRVFYALHVVMALAAAGCLPMPFNRIVATTFVKNRGLAIGFMLSGTGLCGMLMPPYIAKLIEAVGWRGAYIGVGLVPIMGALILSFPLLPKGKPGLAKSTAGAAADVGLTLGQAMRGRRLWILGASLVIGAGLSTGIVSNLVPYLRDAGIGPIAATGPMSLFALAVIVGRLGVGFLVDRFWAPPVVTAVLIPASAALLFMSTHGIDLQSAYICAFCLGLAAGAEADMLSFLPVKYFGLKQLGRIYAFLFILFGAGIGIAGPLFGWVHDRFDSYNHAFFWSGVCWLIVGALLISLGRYPPEAETVPEEGVTP